MMFLIMQEFTGDDKSQNVPSHFLWCRYCSFFSLSLDRLRFEKENRYYLIYLNQMSFFIPTLFLPISYVEGKKS